jgi:hypothetical protein
MLHTAASIGGEDGRATGQSLGGIRAQYSCQEFRCLHHDTASHFLRVQIGVVFLAQHEINATTI